LLLAGGGAIQSGGGIWRLPWRKLLPDKRVVVVTNEVYEDTKHAGKVGNSWTQKEVE
jgi:hypothetical protein